MSLPNETDPNEPPTKRTVFPALVTGLALLAVVAFWTRSGYAFALIGLLGAALALWLLARSARRPSIEITLEDWAQAHDLIYTNPAPVFRDTPTLAAGASQSGEHGFTGAIFGLRGTIYEHIRLESSDASGSGDHLIVLHLAFGLPRLPYLLVHARRPGLPIEQAALRLTDNRLVELESSELAERLLIEVNKQTSDVEVRRLLTPQMIVKLLDLTERPLFGEGLLVEAYAGKLVIATPGRIEASSVAALDELLEAAAPLVTALEAFAAEPAVAASPRYGGDRS
ncbi:MAG: hypothetical protein ACXVYM_08790 [Gaiellaceae bacterium]